MTSGSGGADHITGIGPAGPSGCSRPRNRLAFASPRCGFGAYATLPLSDLVPWTANSLEPASQRVRGGWQGSFLAARALGS